MIKFTPTEQMTEEEIIIAHENSVMLHNRILHGIYFPVKNDVIMIPKNKEHVIVVRNTFYNTYAVSCIVRKYRHRHRSTQFVPIEFFRKSFYGENGRSFPDNIRKKAYHQEDAAEMVKWLMGRKLHVTEAVEGPICDYKRVSWKFKFVGYTICVIRKLRQIR